MLILFNFYKDYYYENKKIHSYGNDDFIIDDISVDELDLNPDLIIKLKSKRLPKLSNLITIGNAFLSSIGFTFDEIEELYNAVDLFLNNCVTDSFLLEEKNDIEESYSDISIDDSDDNFIYIYSEDDFTINLDELENNNNVIDDVYKNVVEIKADISDNEDSTSIDKEEFDYDSDILDELNLSVRSYNVLNNNNIRTYRQISSYTYNDLLNLKNMGIKSANEILEAIAKYQKNDKSHLVKDNIEQDNKNINFDTDILDLLNLSVRSYNVLKDNNIRTYRQISSYTYNDLLNLKNMGIKSAKEILEAIQNIKIEDINKGDLNYIDFLNPNKCYMKYNLIFLNDDSYYINNFELSTLDLTKNLINILKNNDINNLSDYIFKDNINNIDFSTRHINILKTTILAYIKNNIHVYDNNSLIELCKNIILSKLEETGFEGLKRALLIEQLTLDFDNEIILDSIDKLLEERKIFVYLDDVLFYSYQSFPSYIYPEENKRTKDILYSRLDGDTLEVIGLRHGIERERVRQIAAMYISKLDKKVFREDRFKYLFENYNFNCEEFSTIFNEKVRTFNYLNMRYNHGDKDYALALSDTLIPQRLRTCIEKYLDRDKLIIDGRKFPRKKNQLFEYYIYKYCKNPTRSDDIFNGYNDFVSQYDDNLKFDNTRVVEGLLERTRNVLSSVNKMNRYYPYENYDFDYFFEEININSFENIEISTQLLMNNYSNLMEEYDIRDKNELHNLIKRIYKNNPNIKMVRMPHIVFGDYNRRDYLISILKEYGELTTAEFTEVLEERTGVDTQIPFWLNEISDYKTFKCYAYDVLESSKSDSLILNIELDKFNLIMTEDLYTKSEFNRLLKDNGYNFKIDDLSYIECHKLGIKYGCNYVLKLTTNLAEYFTNAFTQKEIFDINKYNKFSYLGQYNNILNKYRNNYDIIEFEKDMYLSIKRLNKINISKEDLKGYCDQVYNFIDNNHFTLKKLRNLGFTSPLDDLGFDDIFYESLLRFDNRFNNNRFNGIYVFNKSYNINKVIFLTDYIKDKVIVERHELVDSLLEEYGIKLKIDKINELIVDTDIYYNEILETYYKDYDTFLKEI